MSANSFAPLALLVVFSARAIACDCAPPPPACEAVGRSELVFLGTVTAVTEPAGSFKTASMNVDKAFKGQLNTTVDLFDNGMCNGPDLQVGKQYLMYTSGFPGGGIPARGCTRSRGIEYAAEDLAFLKQYATGKVATHISGTVRFRPDEPDDSKLGDAGRTPLSNVQVTLSGDGVRFSAKTNPSGNYSFENIAPGEYSVAADLVGYRLDWAPESLKLSANGCAEADLLMKVDRRVEGTVRDSDGLPVSGVLVEMASTDSKIERWMQPAIPGISDESGHYAIDGIPPGEYYLGVNILSTPTKEQPYPKLSIRTHRI
jgi:hypothetical protein